jgi:hypothetical protein
MRRSGLGGWSFKPRNEKAGSVASGPVAFEGNFSPNLAVLARSRSFMALFDIVLREPSHEISGYIAMQHSQLNFVSRRTICQLAIAVLMLAQPVLAAKADPLLDAGPTTSCAAGVDYSGGTDVNGNPVVPADTEGAPIPVPGSVAVPLAGNAKGTGAGRNSAYVGLDGQKLDALVNPKPCS